MIGIILSIVGIILGALISYWISRYFYRIGIKKATLNSYLHFCTKAFSKLEDESLNEKLQVFYDGIKVNNLFQAQFVIVNTGDQPIRNIVKALELKGKKTTKILDASIVYIHPEDREISCTKDHIGSSNKITFPFVLLNPKEYFIIKVLFLSDGDVNNDLIDNFIFKIAAEDLPTELKIENLPQEYLLNPQKKADYASGLISILSLFFLIALVKNLYSFSEINPRLFIFNFKDFFMGFNMDSFFIFISWLSVIFLIFITVILGYIFIDSIRGNTKTIILPNKFTTFTN